MQSHDAIRLLTDHLPEMQQKFGVRALALFGSVARDEAGPDSDVDLLVTFAERPNFDNYMGLKLFLEELFGTRVDLAIPSDLRAPSRARIEQETLHVSYADDAGCQGSSRLPEQNLTRQ